MSHHIGVVPGHHAKTYIALGSSHGGAAHWLTYSSGQSPRHQSPHFTSCLLRTLGPARWASLYSWKLRPVPRWAAIGWPRPDWQLTRFCRTTFAVEFQASLRLSSSRDSVGLRDRRVRRNTQHLTVQRQLPGIPQSNVASHVHVHVQRSAPHRWPAFHCASPAPGAPPVEWRFTCVGASSDPAHIASISLCSASSWAPPQSNGASRAWGRLPTP